MANLINGSGFEYVSAQRDADFFRGITGGDGVFLEVGNNMAYSVPSANTVRILDGEFVTNEGRRIHIDAGSYDDFAIPSGSQGVTTYYFIGYRFYIGTGEQEGHELCETYVYTGSGASDDPTTGKLRDGAQEVIVALYRVKQVGITISEVKALRSTVKPLAYIDTLETALNAQNTSLTSYINTRFHRSGRTNNLYLFEVGHITSSKKALVCGLHLGKPLDPTIHTIGVHGAYATVRQNGIYLYGSANGRAGIDPEECTVSVDSDGNLRLVWSHATVINAKAINNAECTVDLQIRLNLS